MKLVASISTLSIGLLIGLYILDLGRISLFFWGALSFVFADWSEEGVDKGDWGQAVALPAVTYLVCIGAAFVVEKLFA